MAKWGEIKCPRCAEVDDLVQAAVAAALREAAKKCRQGDIIYADSAAVIASPSSAKGESDVDTPTYSNERQRGDLYYVELYETLEQCTADLQEIRRALSRTKPCSAWRLIIKKPPALRPRASDLPHADGSSEDRNVVQADSRSNVAHSVERHAR
jgi:hypothetical protein